MSVSLVDFGKTALRLVLITLALFTAIVLTIIVSDKITFLGVLALGLAGLLFCQKTPVVKKLLDQQKDRYKKE